MQREDYRGIVGSLLYIAKQTRPDILATVTQLSRFLENPGRTHWVAAKRVLRYLKGTKDLELCYIKDPDGFNLYGSADADWAGDVDDRRSTTGYSFHVRSSNQLEYQEATYCSNIYQRSWVSSNGSGCSGRPLLTIPTQWDGYDVWWSNCDQRGQPELHQDLQKSRNAEVYKAHWCQVSLCPRAGRGWNICARVLSTENMEADLLTKSLSKAKVDQHRRTLMGCSLTLDKANSAWVGVLRTDELNARLVKYQTKLKVRLEQ